jgi:hypothetical protein
MGLKNKSKGKKTRKNILGIKGKRKGISDVLVVQIATGFHWAVPDQDLWLGNHFAYTVPIISVESATFHTSDMQDK